ncbi:MAG TPA: TonB-dependent receptor, partial [Candidatus Baltobacteraceae bacterium]|nr:TonB-dependent receptor [Candidatus Baltobacteraceae bacterium]
MKRYCIFAFVLATSIVSLQGAGRAAQGSTVSARILDTQGGLPVPGATVELDRAGGRVATAQTDAYGTARLSDVAAGTYVVLIRANGYQTARLSPDLLVSAGVPEISFQIGLSRANGLKTIGYVTTAGRISLQTTSTINTPIDTSMLQSENYQRLGDLLNTVPGVTTFTSSSVGDDMSLSIRGFDSTET